MGCPIVRVLRGQGSHHCLRVLVLPQFMPGLLKVMDFDGWRRPGVPAAAHQVPHRAGARTNGLVRRQDPSAHTGQVHLVPRTSPKNIHSYRELVTKRFFHPPLFLPRPAVLAHWSAFFAHPALHLGEFGRCVEHEPIPIRMVLLRRAMFQEMPANDAVDPGAGKATTVISAAEPEWATVSMCLSVGVVRRRHRHGRHLFGAHPPLVIRTLLVEAAFDHNGFSASFVRSRG